MAFDGKAFGDEIVVIVRNFVARSLEPLVAANTTLAVENAALAARLAALEARLAELEARDAAGS